jgi:hypothetical protein
MTEAQKVERGVKRLRRLARRFGLRRLCSNQVNLNQFVRFYLYAPPETSAYVLYTELTARRVPCELDTARRVIRMLKPRKNPG